MRVLLLSSLITAIASKAPHLVFILVDDMGYNDFYSSTDISAAWSNVQKLASDQCVKVDQYYTQPICTPTRGAFMSGRYPARLGLQHGVIAGAQNYGLPLDEVTLADKLHAAGYNTIGVGKWHLGMYNNASTPTQRGFNHFFGYYNGAEDYYTHEIGGYLDLHDDEVPNFDFNGTYGMDMFHDHVSDRISEHATTQSKDTPMFLYLPFQNVHSPLEAPAEYTEAEPCASITDANRKTFCGMAKAADEAIGKITTQIDSLFPKDDVVYVISGDNGGQTSAAGNNCPDFGKGKVCLRGQKGDLYEGGVRNNALLCSKTLIPDGMKGQTYSKGLVHITDWHATLRDLGGASDKGSKVVDGKNVFDAITSNADSPRTEFFINLDPCSGRQESCAGKESAYRFNGCVGDDCGDWKYYDVHTALGWFPPVMEYKCSGRGGCEAPSSFSGSGTPSAFKASAADTGDQLFDLSSDPNEENNVAATYPEVVTELKSRIAAIENGDDYLAPCNIPDGSCIAEDSTAFEVFAEHGNAWFPWVADEVAAVV
jgi:arylsulfatase B/arylsulfatase I/J